MKKILKEYFPVVIAVFGVFFAIGLYFGTNGSEDGLFTNIGTALDGTEDGQIISGVDIETVASDTDVPEIKYVGGARIVGEFVDFRVLLHFTFEDGSSASGTDTEKFTIYFKDITDMSDNSVCEKLTTEDIASMEEIPSAFVYDKEMNLLYFHKSGKYMMYIRVYYSADTYVDYEFAIPVEAG